MEVTYILEDSMFPFIQWVHLFNEVMPILQDYYNARVCGWLIMVDEM